MTNKEKEEEFKKNLVLESAWNVFMDKGFTETTMNDIAEKSDYALGTIYKLFESKDEIFVLLVKKKLEELHSLFAQCDDPLKSPIERMRGLVQICIDFFSKNIRMVQLLQFEPWAGDIRMTKSRLFDFIEHFENVTRIFIDIIEQGIEQGSFRKVDPLKARLAFRGIFHDLFWNKALKKEHIDTDSMVEDVMSFLLYGIANQPQIPNQTK
jgi:TetR/AcrR family transcriptional regulator